MNDEELALFYYNYRYYNPADGRWINRDLYSMLENNAITFYNEKEMAVPAIACGGIVVGTYTYTAAKMMGLSVCVCLATTACRKFIVKLTKEPLRQACTEGCHLAYGIQAAACKFRWSARERALCYAQAAENCAM